MSKDTGLCIFTFILLGVNPKIPDFGFTFFVCTSVLFTGASSGWGLGGGAGEGHDCRRQLLCPLCPCTLGVATISELYLFNPGCDLWLHTHLVLKVIAEL